MASDRPGFIIGSMRSGTTLLRYLLNTHEHLACPPETKLAAALAHLQIVPALCSLGFNRDEVLLRLRATLESFLNDYTRAAGKRRWIDKTPAHCFVLPFLDEMFAYRAQYIIILRHPLDCICSLQDFSERFPSFSQEDPRIESIVRQFGPGMHVWGIYWLEAYKNIHWFVRSNPERCHLIRYENLVREPEPLLSAALTFLGEDASLLRIDTAFQNNADGYQDDKIRLTDSVHSRSVGCSDRLDEDSRKTLWDLTGAMALRLGYTIDPREANDGALNVTRA